MIIETNRKIKFGPVNWYVGQCYSQIASEDQYEIISLVEGETIGKRIVSTISWNNLNKKYNPVTSEKHKFEYRENNGYQEGVLIV